MRINKALINNIIIGAILFLLSGFIASCSKQSAASSTKSKGTIETVETTSETNPQVKSALDLINKKPDEPLGYSLLALSYIKLARESGDFSLNSKAETAVNRSLEIDPENAVAKKIQASLLLTFHRFSEGLEKATRLQKEYPQDAVVYGALTDANVELGNYEDAVSAVQKMVDLRPNMESYARVSHVRSLYGDTNGAIEAMSTAAKIADPADKEVRAWCRVFLGNEYFKAGKIAEADGHYDDALKAFPDYYLALAGKGRVAASGTDLDKAVKFLSDSNNRVPNVENIILLGDVYTKLGQPDEAKNQYDLAQFIEQQFGNLDGRRLALLWADHDIKLDEALELARIEHEKRRDIYTADVYAWCLYKKGQMPEAKQAITEALRLRTKDARIFYHAGMIEKGLGNNNAAGDYLQKALQTNPAFDILETYKAKAALQELKK